MTYLDFYLEQAVDPPEHIYDYLLGRGVTRKQISLFGIKYFDKILELKRGHVEYDNFKIWSSDGRLPKGKIVFPLRNSLSELIGFTLQDLKGFKTKFFLKTSEYEGLFFGLPQALPEIWKTEEVYLVEGPFDLFPVFRLFKNTLSILTTNISATQVLFLRRFVKRIFALLDNDKAGENGFVKLNKKLGSSHEIIKIPYLAKDPNDLWKKYGDFGFEKVIREKLERLILI